MKDKKFIGLSFLFFLLFLVGMATLTLNQPITRFLRARDVTPSPLKSFIIVFPQKAKTGSAVKVSVYIRDIGGNALSGRSVKLTTNPSSSSITPAEIQSTNELGLAQFSLTSSTPATFQLTAADIVSNTAISNTPTVEFTP